jgi:hypothetical protein
LWSIIRFIKASVAVSSISEQKFHARLLTAQGVSAVTYVNTDICIKHSPNCGCHIESCPGREGSLLVYCKYKHKWWN